MMPEFSPLIVRFPARVAPSADDFFDFCQANPNVRIERTAEGDVIVMTPAGGESSRRNAEIVRQLADWARSDGTGLVFDSSAGFTLPDGAIRSPDAAWVARGRLARLTSEQRERFLPLCPDVVIELRSPSDALSDLHEKMREYLANGARLGWLIDPFDRQVFVYRPGQSVERVAEPVGLLGDPVLPAFTLDLREIWSDSL